MLVGAELGVLVGVAVGDSVSISLGATVGAEVGRLVGCVVGVAVGVAVTGALVGIFVGPTVGKDVGDVVGVAVGERVIGAADARLVEGGIASGQPHGPRNFSTFNRSSSLQYFSGNRPMAPARLTSPHLTYANVRECNTWKSD